MTLEEILNKYDVAKFQARSRDEWSELDNMIEELAQLAAGTPITPGGDSPYQFFNEQPSRWME